MAKEGIRMATRSIGDLQRIGKQNGSASVEGSISAMLPNADIRNPSGCHLTNELNELGQKIFLDRYALKDIKKRTLMVGDLVIACIDVKTGQMEIGFVRTINETP